MLAAPSPHESSVCLQPRTEVWWAGFGDDLVVEYSKRLREKSQLGYQVCWPRTLFMSRILTFRRRRSFTSSTVFIVARTPCFFYVV